MGALVSTDFTNPRACGLNPMLEALTRGSPKSCVCRIYLPLRWRRLSASTQQGGLASYPMVRGAYLWPCFDGFRVSGWAAQESKEAEAGGPCNHSSGWNCLLLMTKACILLMLIGWPWKKPVWNLHRPLKDLIRRLSYDLLGLAPIQRMLRLE